ncbi:MAG: error-prone DNA polymerase [bacterium]
MSLALMMIAMTEYVELHTHSNFSFLDGACHPEDLAKHAAGTGYRALALTDHNGFYGLVRFNKAALENGIKPIVGSEITLENGHHLVFLVTDSVGYANLSQMLTLASMKGKKGEATVATEILKQHHQGLIALSGCIKGEISSALLGSEVDKAEEIARYYDELFGAGNFYLELQHHLLPHHDLLCEQLSQLGRRLGIPIVATNNVHYLTPDGRRLQDVLTCIKHHTTLDNAGAVLYPNAERYLKSPAEMIARFRNYPDAIANTVAIAERCNFILEKLDTSLPDFAVSDGETTDSYLRKLTYHGAGRRYDELSSDVISQIEHELGIIKRLNLAGYFLIVWDIASFCKNNGILCQGRGSAANSAVCYCLEITAVDPIKLGLLFERFVSEHRREPPDIDIDIANNRREEVIQYVYNKYGREHAAMVCEVISYRGRSAVRDVGKALGFSIDEVGKLAKLMDYWTQGDEIEERIIEAGFNRRDRRIHLLIDLVKQIRRFPRHLGIHVGGMIVTKAPLSKVVPIENASMPDRSVIQWDKDDAEEVRFVKIDLLGLGMLSLLDIAFTLIKKHRGISIDMGCLPHDDPKVYELICKADTVGVFQIESRAQMNTLPRHQPRRFYDLVIEVALIRPGPIQGDMVHPYLRRRNGEEEITYPHPILKPILDRTLGIPLFQEQGMRVAIEAAGFTPSEADELRRAMGHKRSHEKMQALAERLIDGMKRNGIAHEAALKIFDQLSAFADFGFAESHAASFALLVYVSCYLKVYYPQEFYCSLLNAQPMGFYSPSTIIYEAQRRGIVFRDVDITRSEWDCTVEDDAVRLGFCLVKGLGKSAKDQIEPERTRRAFDSVEDFVFRTELHRDGLEQLATIGAFRAFGLSRRQALWKVLSLLNRKQDEFRLQTPEKGHDLLLPMNPIESMVSDFKGMSLSTQPHLMTMVRDELRQKNIAAAADLNDRPNSRVVVTAGVVVIRQRPMTAKGFMFITLEDETGFSNIVVKPNILKHYRKVIVRNRGLIVTGQLEKRDGVINVIGHHFEPLTIDQQRIKIRSRDFR